MIKEVRGVARTLTGGRQKWLKTHPRGEGRRGGGEGGEGKEGGRGGRERKRRVEEEGEEGGREGKKEGGRGQYSTNKSLHQISEEAVCGCVSVRGSRTCIV